MVESLSASHEGPISGVREIRLVVLVVVETHFTHLSHTNLPPFLPTSLPLSVPFVGYFSPFPSSIVTILPLIVRFFLFSFQPNRNISTRLFLSRFSPFIYFLQFSPSSHLILSITSPLFLSNSFTRILPLFNFFSTFLSSLSFQYSSIPFLLVSLSSPVPCFKVRGTRLPLDGTPSCNHGASILTCLLVRACVCFHYFY